MSDTDSNSDIDDRAVHLEEGEVDASEIWEADVEDNTAPSSSALVNQEEYEEDGTIIDIDTLQPQITDRGRYHKRVVHYEESGRGGTQLHQEGPEIPVIMVDSPEEDGTGRKENDLAGKSEISLTEIGDGMSKSKSSVKVGSTTSLDVDYDIASKSAMDLSQAKKHNIAKMKHKRTAVQVTTFTNWVNDCLKPGKHDRKVESLFEDLKDGMLLIKLLENLTKKKVKGFTIPKTEAHKIVNLDVAFRFMQSENIKLIGVGGINIYQSDQIRTLGMIWMLIQKYQMRIHGYKVSTKEVMIKWVQALLPRWDISNLTSDWSDGRALIAMLNAVKPGIAPNISTIDPERRLQNCVQATNIASSYLKIPKIISPEDVSSGSIDEWSVMTYLSYFVEPFRARLLKWVQKMLPQYGIMGFSQDWYNGRAFGALLVACFSGIAFSLSQQDSPQAYVEEFIRLARKKLGISPPFEAADLLRGKVEELQVMTMVMLIRNSDLVSLPDEVVVSGEGIEAAQLMEETFFTVNVTEAGPGQLSIQASYEDDGRKLTFKLAEKTKGSFCLFYTPPTMGNVVFDIFWSDVPIPQSPFVVSVTDPSLVNMVDFDPHNTLVEIGKPQSLQFAAEKAGQGQLSGYLECGGERIEVETSVLPNNMFKLDFTPPTTGEAVLHVLWNKEELHHLAVNYNIVDIGGYSVRSLPKKKFYTIFEEPEFTVISEKGLPLDVLQMTAVLSLDVQVPIKFDSINGNIGYAKFLPVLPGTYRVEVVCVDQLIKGSPFDVCVSDPHGCRVRGKMPSFLGKATPQTFEIDVSEAGVGEITFESADHDISSLFKAELKPTDSKDLQKLEVTPLVEGDYLVGIKYQKKWISNSPFRVQVCDPTKFTVVERLTSGYVGKPIQFTVKGKEKCKGNLKPLFKATGPTAKYTPQVQPSKDGLSYSVKFVPWEIGEHVISIIYGTIDIPNTPIKLPVSSLGTDSISAAGAGLQRAYTNIPAQFVILGKEAGLIENGTLSIRIAGVVDNNECKIRTRDNGDGKYNIAYLVHKQGAYLISILMADVHIPGSPFKLNAMPGPEASKCRIYGPALEEDTILTFGKPIDFTVDTSGAGVGKLSVKAVGPDGHPAKVFIAKSGQPGKSDINIDAHTHGKHRVAVKWSNQHVPGSPFLIKVFPGADARKCLAYGPGLEDGRVGQKSSFTIETKNAGAGVLRVRLHGIKGAFKIQITPVDQKNRRTLLANYNPKLPGEYLITIKWSEVHIPGSPFRVRIEGGDENPGMPNVFTPTPRILDETTGFIDEEEEEEGFGKSGGGAPKPIQGQQIQPSFTREIKEQVRSKQKRVMVKQPVKRVYKRRQSSPIKSKGAKKFEGRATISVAGNPKKKPKKGKR